SSRRRHTRSYGDWSSDVCSSDLRWSGVATAITSRSGKSRRMSCHGVAPKYVFGACPVHSLNVAAERFADASERVATATSSNFTRSEEHTSELQSPYELVCRLLLE